MLYIKDPLSLKESILIASEALSRSGYQHLTDVAKSIPSVIGQVSLELSYEVESHLLDCIQEFRYTKTYYYLREDFKNTLYDVELQLNTRVS